MRVLAKVGEASLKGRNKRFFLDTLRRNLKAALQGVDARLEDGGSVTTIVVPDEGAAEEVGARLERVFGFAAASTCLACERDPEAITAAALRVIEQRRPASFRGTGAAPRQELSAHVAGARARDRSRDPEGHFAAARRSTSPGPSSSCVSRSTIATRTSTSASWQTAGGLPVGTSGRAVSLLSGGIDSPVASLLAMKRGLGIDFVHFSGEPYLEPVATGKARAQARVLNGFQAARPGSLWVVPFGNQQRMLSAVSPSPNRIVLYRRQMARIGCALAARLGAAALVTGDSLGQVSSQTLPNMTSVDDASPLPVLRPLLAWDKREVMARAAALGILALSELAAEDACPLFTEGKQRTAVPRAELLEAEAQLDLAELAEQGAAEARQVDPGVFLDRLEPESRAG